MKIRDLLAQLEGYNSDLEVFIDTSEYSYEPNVRLAFGHNPPCVLLSAWEENIVPLEEDEYQV
jgi:hypothetical protein